MVILQSAEVYKLKSGANKNLIKNSPPSNISSLLGAVAWLAPSVGGCAPAFPTLVKTHKKLRRDSLETGPRVIEGEEVESVKSLWVGEQRSGMKMRFGEAGGEVGRAGENTHCATLESANVVRRWVAAPSFKTRHV